MFGLEDYKKKAFQFDLELDLKKQPKKMKEILSKAQANMQEIKNCLKEGQKDKEDLDNLGVLLHGYSALEKVLNKVAKS